MPTPALTAGSFLRHVTRPLIFALAVLTALAVTQLAATSAEAAKGPRAVKVQWTACNKATETEPWGGITVALKLDKHLPPEGEPYLVVVDGVDGHEVDRFFVDAPRYRAKFRVAADGLTRTPDLVITASVGGDVLGRTRVFRNCGWRNPNPPQAPVIEGFTVENCDVSVTVTNPSDQADELLVALFPEGSNTAPLRFVDLPAGDTGTVTFEAQAAGTYSAEAESVTTFLSTETPFDIVVPAGCLAA